MIDWHPAANNILASSGYDNMIIIWNVTKAVPVIHISIHPDTIYSMSWNRIGSHLVTTCKDKILRIFDARSGQVAKQGECHKGGKPSKVVWCKVADKELIFTTGFTKYSERQYAVWSPDNLSSPLKMETLDSSSGKVGDWIFQDKKVVVVAIFIVYITSTCRMFNGLYFLSTFPTRKIMSPTLSIGVLTPIYDPDTNMMYLAGRGDGNVRFFELLSEAPWVCYLNEFISGTPHRSLGVMPKRGVDVMSCEITRFYKLHINKELVEPISMVVPRKTDMFQDDIYPETAAPIAALTGKIICRDENIRPKPPNTIRILIEFYLMTTFKPNL